MGKKISKILLVVGIILTAYCAFATPPLPSVHYQFQPVFPVRFDKPFELHLEWCFRPEPEVTSLDISLPEGVDLLEGDLHWGGKVVRDSMYHKNLLVKMSKPGTYEITTDFIASQLHDTRFEKQFPIHGSIFFYVREDTIAVFWNRAEMETAIKYSQIIPEEQLEARYQKRVWNKHRDEMKKSNTPPITISKTLVSIMYEDMYAFNDSINLSNLSQFYTPSQVGRIKQYVLLFEAPRLERVQNFLEIDWLPDLTVDQKDSLVQLIFKQATELYNLDQRILQSEQADEREKLLKERRALLPFQNKERKTLLNPEPPTPR